MKKLLVSFIIIPTMVAMLFTSCKDDDEVVVPNGTITIGITDTRSSHTKSGIIDANMLSSFIFTISSIDLVTENNSYVNVLNEPVSFDLRNYQGTVKDLASVEIPMVKYKGAVINIAGFASTYDGNTYISSAVGGPSLELNVLPGYPFNSDNGVPNLFGSGYLGLTMSFNFELNDSLDNRKLIIGIDAVSACDKMEFSCATCGGTQYFASLSGFIFPHIYFKEGIQQIKHSAPLEIQLTGGTAADYYGIHTFVDFNGVGGTINSHTSQHYLRTDNGSFIAAEVAATNNSALSTNTINASGETDVRSDEVFNFSAIKTYLNGQGVTLVPGTKYYFSLNKTWNVTLGSTNYTLSRLCEPIPVVWPNL